jgi:hypothetical protein
MSLELPSPDSPLGRRLQASFDGLEKFEDLYQAARAALPIHMRRDIAAIILGLEEQKIFWTLVPGWYGYKFGELPEHKIKFLFSQQPSQFELVCTPYHYA